MRSAIYRAAWPSIAALLFNSPSRYRRRPRRLGMFQTMVLAAAATIAAPVAADAPKPPALAIARAPSDPIAYRSLTQDAKAAFDSDDYAKAEQLYRQAVALYAAE